MCDILNSFSQDTRNPLIEQDTVVVFWRTVAQFCDFIFYLSLILILVDFFFVALRPNAGHGLMLEVSRSHTTTHHSR